MRTILFRQWLGAKKGFHIITFTDGHCTGVAEVALSVYPISEFIGLKDKNNTSIMEI